MIAGITTFAAMAYIVAVNPGSCRPPGMDRGDLVIATALAAIFGSLMMGLTANLPLPWRGDGSNIVFAYVVVKQMGIPCRRRWRWSPSPVIFLALSLSKLRGRWRRRCRTR